LANYLGLNESQIKTRIEFDNQKEVNLIVDENLKELNIFGFLDFLEKEIK